MRVCINGDLLIQAVVRTQWYSTFHFISRSRWIFPIANALVGWFQTPRKKNFDIRIYYCYYYFPFLLLLFLLLCVEYFSMMMYVTHESFCQFPVQIQLCVYNVHAQCVRVASFWSEITDKINKIEQSEKNTIE